MVTASVTAIHHQGTCSTNDSPPSSAGSGVCCSAMMRDSWNPPQICVDHVDRSAAPHLQHPCENVILVHACPWGWLRSLARGRGDKVVRRGLVGRRGGSYVGRCRVPG